MTPQDFIDLQEGLVYVFAPVISWMLTITVAFGFIAAIGWIFLYLFQWLTREG